MQTQIRLTAPANTADPDQSSLIRASLVCHCVCIFLAIHVSVHVKTALFDDSNAGVRILRNFMNESWGKLKLLGDKLKNCVCLQVAYQTSSFLWLISNTVTHLLPEKYW